MNPRIYRRQIAEIGIEDMVIDVSTIQRSMDTMSDLDELENLLNKIKFNLNTDIRNLRVDYMKQMQEAEGLVGTKSFLGRKKTRDDVVQKKKELKKKRDADIAAYELIEDLVNNYLTQIEDSRVYIRNHIQKKVV